jgi:hypothetical protein
VAAGIGAILNRTENYTESVSARGRQIANRMLPVELAAAAITLVRLCPAAGTQVEALLGDMSMAEAAMWPDTIRGSAEWAHTRDWHYINIDDVEPMDALVEGEPGHGRLLSAIRHNHALLADEAAAPQRRREALAELPLAPVQPEDAPGAPQVVDGWIGEWCRRLPAAGRAPDGELAKSLEAIRDHVETMRSSVDTDGRALRSALASRLARRFRRGAGTDTALFSPLVLDGLELERVRAGVMARRLMPERAEGRSWA